MTSDAADTPGGTTPPGLGQSPLGHMAARVAPRERARVRPVWELLALGVKAQPWGILAALAGTYTALTEAIFFATIFALVGAVSVFATTISHTMGRGVFSSIYNAGVNGGLNFFAILAGAGAGAVLGFLFVFGGSIIHVPGTILATLLSGAIIAVGLTSIIIVVEQRWLLLRGYRRMSWEEKTRIGPLIQGAAAALRIDVDDAPPIMISDERKPGAWTHCTAIVLTSDLLAKLDDDELRGVLAHELHHWKAGHAVGQILIATSAFPLVLLFNAGVWLSRAGRRNFLTFIAYCVIWPVWVVVRLLVAPLQGIRSRTNEYAADAAATAAGTVYRDGLRAALLKLSAFEPGRTGWEAAMVATHPPIALRIERIISPEEVARRADVVAREGVPRWWRSR